jgi:phage terminase small subunit
MPKTTHPSGLTLKERNLIVNVPKYPGQQGRAAVESGYSKRSADSLASETLKRPKVALALRIHNDTLLDKSQIDIDFLIDEYLSINKQAKDAKQYGAAKSCIDSIGKIIGAFIERVEVVNPATDRPYKGLSTETLEALIYITSKLGPDAIKAIVDREMGVLEGEFRPIPSDTPAI